MSKTAELRERIKALESALRPFAAAVFNDNGDVTINQSRLKTLDWMMADAALNNFRGRGGTTRRKDGSKP